MRGKLALLFIVFALVFLSYAGHCERLDMWMDQHVTPRPPVVIPPMQCGKTLIAYIGSNEPLDFNEAIKEMQSFCASETK